MTLTVLEMPWTTDKSLSPVARCSSRTRESRNTSQSTLRPAEGTYLAA